MATISGPNAGFTHLHYGGSQNQRTGALGPKPSRGNTFRKYKRYELMARLENAGLTDAAIASMLVISVPRLRHLKKAPDYLIARMKITHGLILDQDSQLDMIKSQRKEMLVELLPPALQILANELQRPAHTIAERKHQTGIALELLDREGTFAKVSRTEIKPVDVFDFERTDEASRSIISAIRAAAPPAGESAHTVISVAANQEFSNSHTLSATDQQAALETLERTSLTEELLETMQTPTESVN